MGQTNAPLFKRDAQIELMLYLTRWVSSVGRQYVWATSKRRDRNEARTKAEHISDPEYANLLVFVELSCLHSFSAPLVYRLQNTLSFGIFYFKRHGSA